MIDFKGKTAIVTGGGRDIGRACAIALGMHGANVAINYHSSAEGAESAAAEINAAGSKAFALQGDVTSQNDIQALTNRTVEEFGQIDILVHVSGGIVGRTPIADMSDEHWQKVIDLNLTSFVNISRAVIPHLSENSSIVGLASQAGRDGGGGGAAAYAASKGALMTLVRGLAKELGPKTRVNAVCPGMIDTDFHNIHTKDEVRSHVANITPLKREGRPEEVADLVAFLASNRSSFMTGTNIDINGGLYFS